MYDFILFCIISFYLFLYILDSHERTSLSVVLASLYSIFIFVYFGYFYSIILISGSSTGIAMLS